MSGALSAAIQLHRYAATEVRAEEQALNGLNCRGQGEWQRFRCQVPYFFVLRNF
jgi:hypothetical protein